MMIYRFMTRLSVLCLYGVASLAMAAVDPLPSWQTGASKQAIVQFVQTVTDPRSADFVPVAERIATFDNDGTLWAEQPAYTQLFFAIDRLKALAPQHPQWQQKEPYRSLLKGDLHAAGVDEKALLEMVMATHAGMSSDDFTTLVRQWIQQARHPVTGRPFTNMVYQPMLELLNYLRANGFKTYIVSGGGVEFMRAWSEEVYGIPPEQVIGSSIRTHFAMVDGQPQLMRDPVLNFIDDKAGKPVGIHQYIGRRPIAAFGNSDGDLQMLQWTTAGKGRRLGLIVHHTDAKREWAYDRHSSVGQLDKALDMATSQHWVVVDMQKEWKQIFPAL